MRQIIVSIHRVQTTICEVDDDFDHDGELDWQLDWDYLSARLHEDTDIITIRTQDTTQGEGGPS
ncbi:hypothetical protein [Microbacterium rhizophilus]|uniref:hypothetical protein n=1 Tax=Microbacterium rhizophilus TaxID=3138934 RepID=UPI0031EE4D98